VQTQRRAIVENFAASRDGNSRFPKAEKYLAYLSAAPPKNCGRSGSAALVKSRSRSRGAKCTSAAITFGAAERRIFYEVGERTARLVRDARRRGRRRRAEERIALNGEERQDAAVGTFGPLCKIYRLGQ
jgi:hypothetical protein